MATEFTLSQSKDKALPEAVTVDGSAFHIDANFRNMLRILRMLNDESVVDRHKVPMLLEWFYDAALPRNVEAALVAFRWFLRCGDDAPDDATGEPPVFDYEQDAREVYASFMALYGIDLFESDMHWWRFSALLDGAFRAPCALSDKINLRTLDASKYENPEKIRKAQAAIRIENAQTRADREIKDKLFAVLTGGGDVSAALEAIKQNGI